MDKDYADATEIEQLGMIQQTDNSLKSEDEEIKQPPQDSEYQPDPDEVVEKI